MPAHAQMFTRKLPLVSLKSRKLQQFHSEDSPLRLRNFKVRMELTTAASAVEINQAPKLLASFSLALKLSVTTSSAGAQQASLIPRLIPCNVGQQ